MEQERAYLAKTLEIIKDRQTQLEQSQKAIKKEFKQTIKVHGEDFREISRGDDLSNSFNIIFTNNNSECLL